MRRTLLAVSAALALALSSIPQPASAQADPLALLQQFVDAHNRGDVAAQIGLLAPDALYVGPGGPCSVSPGCAGLQAIQRELERQASSHRTITIVTSQVSGSALSGSIELRSDGTRARGVARLIVELTMEVRGDKIAVIREAHDLRDPATAAFVGVAPSVAQLPRAGEEIPLGPLGAVLGAALMGLGWRLWRTAPASA